MAMDEKSVSGHRVTSLWARLVMFVLLLAVVGLTVKQCGGDLAIEGPGTFKAMATGRMMVGF
jgi:hypothetical protein